ncbi:MAG: ABC transporter substrate-binding protein [Betaproteobacteria bacterium]
MKPPGVAVALAALAMLFAGDRTGAAPEPIVIGQSLPMTGASFPIANRVLAGARAQVERVNAAGGIHGHALELVTLDDGGDARRLASNLRSLVIERNAVAIVNCLGERACLAAAEATRALHVPLVGPFSGSRALRASPHGNVFSMRPDDEREAGALARQLRAIGVARAALLADDSEPVRTAALAAALRREGIEVTRFAASPGDAALEAAFRGVAQAAPQALVLGVGPDVLDALGRLPVAARDGVPSTIATLSSTGLTQLTRLFRDRLIGYTSVVPNPEVAHQPIVRDLQRDADAYIGPEAVTFEGLESYLHLRLCVEALRRAEGGSAGMRLSEAIERLGALELGGFAVSFGRDRHQGSDFVEIGMRARDGRLQQ